MPAGAVWERRNDPQWNWMNSLEDVPENLLQEIEQFFKICAELEGKKAEVHGWQDHERALRVIDELRRRFEERRNSGRSVTVEGSPPGSDEL